MVFEVDNTTEKLIAELQSGIREVIGDIEKSQSEIKELLDGLKLVCNDLATADQADTLGDDITKVKTSVSKLATGEQMGKHEVTLSKILEEQRNISTAAGEVKTDLTKLIEKTEQRSIEILQAQIENAQRYEQLFRENRMADMQERTQQLQAIGETLKGITEHLTSKMDNLSIEAQTMTNIGKENNAVLKAIQKYLSLPGYKRFFKGMEVNSDEATQ